MALSENQVKDIIEWDIHNWSQALGFWSTNSRALEGGKDCLELGGRKGGPSLWLALSGNRVLCTDLTSPEEQASVLHQNYDVADKVSYQAINALDIPFKEKYDIIIFKSIMGGVSRDGQHENKRAMIQGILHALKPGGQLLFAENLSASPLHRFLRNRFIKWGSSWNYLSHDEIDPLFIGFSQVKFETLGFFGAFGRSEGQRKFLGTLDSILKPVIPKSFRYIAVGVATK